MTFYLKPPEGSIPPYKFEQFAECRLKFLLSVITCHQESLTEIIQKTVTSSLQLESVLEGTVKDRVSHFALRTAVIRNITLHKIVLDGERLLFEKRLHQMNAKTIDLSVKQLRRHLKEYIPFLKKNFKTPSYIDFIEPTYTILGTIAAKKLLRWHEQNQANSVKSFRLQSSEDELLCPQHGNVCILSVPFTLVPELVAKREVHLSNGFAELKCADIPKYLSTVFMKILECSSFTMRNSLTVKKCFEEDIRFIDVSKVLKRVFQTHSTFGSIDNDSIRWTMSSRLLPLKNRITLHTLDNEVAQYFPPCMRNYYTTLRRDHRLPHESRFKFTLFLKDIGFSVEDCINLLKQEYSKSSTESSSSSVCSSASPGKCSHSWEKDSSRYIYGTRHMYGLEGARKEYSSHSCQSIIQSTLSGSCGGDGCPFVNCNQNTVFHKNLETELESQQLGSHIPEFLFSLKNETSLLPIESCHIYLSFKTQKLSPCSSGSSTSSCTNFSSEENENSMAKSNTITNITCVDSYTSKPAHFYMKLKNDGNIIV